MSEKKATKKAISRTAGRTSKGFTAEERAAMEERAQELKAEVRRADGEKVVLEKIAEMPASDRAMATRIRAVIKDSARAEATLLVGEAGATKKAAAYKEYEEGAILELMISRLPDIARAVAEPISNVNDLTIIDTEGASKLTKMTANTVKELDSVLESFTGSSLTALIGGYLDSRQAKNTAATPDARAPEASDKAK